VDWAQKDYEAQRLVARSDLNPVYIIDVVNGADRREKVCPSKLLPIAALLRSMLGRVTQNPAENTIDEKYNRADNGESYEGKQHVLHNPLQEF
jgi:hypothetical protein